MGDKDYIRIAALISLLIGMIVAGLALYVWSKV